jgi:hypothetical protein
LTGVESANALSLQNSTGLASPDQTITFDEFVVSQDASITNEYSSLGVTFSPNLYFDTQYNFPNITPNSLSNFGVFSGSSPITPVSIFFNQAQNAAAFSVITQLGTSTFTALLDGSVVETFNAPTTFGDPNNFYGFTGVVFDEIQITPGGDANIMNLDNLQTGTASTPVPFEFSPTLGLLLVGGLFGGNRLYRQHRASKLVFNGEE